jgi:hypothetical protein
MLMIAHMFGLEGLMVVGDCNLALCVAILELFLSHRREMFAKNACIPPKMSF